MTGDNGHRLFYNLSQGVYKIVVEKEGYNRYDEGEVTVEGVFKPDPPYGVVRGTLESLRSLIGWFDINRDIFIVVNVEYRWSRNFGVVLEGARYNFKLENSDENFHWWNVSPTIRYYPQVKILSPFINIGPSLYIPEEGDVRIGGKIGVGIELAISKRFAFELGADYQTIFKKSKKGFELENRINLMGLHVGIALRL